MTALPPGNDVVLSWDPSPRIENQTEQTPCVIPTGDPPPYNAVRLPTVPTKYKFSRLSFNSMLLLPPPESPDSRALYNVTVQMNCFNALSSITTVRRGANDGGTLVTEYEIGMTRKRALVFMQGREYTLQRVLKPVQVNFRNNNGIWKWDGPQFQFQWNCSSSPYVCERIPSPNEPQSKVYAKFQQGSPRRRDGSIPDLGSLEVEVDGYERLDEILVSALLLEQIFLLSYGTRLELAGLYNVKDLTWRDHGAWENRITRTSPTTITMDSNNVHERFTPAGEPAPKAFINYTFVRQTPNTMVVVLHSSESAPPSEVYRVAVNTNFFNPLSSITTITDVVSDALVAEFETGITLSPMLVYLDGGEYPLKGLIQPIRSGYVKPNSLWAWTGPKFKFKWELLSSHYICRHNHNDREVYAKYTPGQRGSDGRIPQIGILEVILTGHDKLVEMVVSLLLMEQQRLVPDEDDLHKALNFKARKL